MWCVRCDWLVRPRDNGKFGWSCTLVGFKEEWVIVCTERWRKTVLATSCGGLVWLQEIYFSHNFYDPLYLGLYYFYTRIEEAVRICILLEAVRLHRLLAQDCASLRVYVSPVKWWYEVIL
ncbi:hypothetical protein PoB_002232100 [Plakobranchus ocellatus]|uniref:Uncharacterized protein n=1 Tax=Plakobranchus ocellatus TaxID=259542 RepID=A0AAV3ZMR9_9GAST|nr:hypothetical protein PoB_002232100 [Plakobranchus ocellatus]